MVWFGGHPQDEHQPAQPSAPADITRVAWAGSRPVWAVSRLCQTLERAGATLASFLFLCPDSLEARSAAQRAVQRVAHPRKDEVLIHHVVVPAAELRAEALGHHVVVGEHEVDGVGVGGEGLAGAHVVQHD